MYKKISSLFIFLSIVSLGTFFVIKDYYHKDFFGDNYIPSIEWIGKYNNNDKNVVITKSININKNKISDGYNIEIYHKDGSFNIGNGKLVGDNLVFENNLLNQKTKVTVSKKNNGINVIVDTNVSKNKNLDGDYNIVSFKSNNLDGKYIFGDSIIVLSQYSEKNIGVFLLKVNGKNYMYSKYNGKINDNKIICSTDLTLIINNGLIVKYNGVFDDFLIDNNDKVFKLDDSDALADINSDIIISDTIYEWLGIYKASDGKVVKIDKIDDNLCISIYSEDNSLENINVTSYDDNEIEALRTISGVNYSNIIITKIDNGLNVDISYINMPDDNDILNDNYYKE